MESYKLDDNRLSAQNVFRKDPTRQELKWERMKDTLNARRGRILDPAISKITVRIFYSQLLNTVENVLSL